MRFVRVWVSDDLLTLYLRIRPKLTTSNAPNKRKANARERDARQFEGLMESIASASAGPSRAVTPSIKTRTLEPPETTKSLRIAPNLADDGVSLRTPHHPLPVPSLSAVRPQPATPMKPLKPPVAGPSFKKPPAPATPQRAPPKKLAQLPTPRDTGANSAPTPLKSRLAPPGLAPHTPVPKYTPKIPITTPLKTPSIFAENLVTPGSANGKGKGKETPTRDRGPFKTLPVPAASASTLSEGLEQNVKQGVPSEFMNGFEISPKKDHHREDVSARYGRGRGKNRFISWVSFLSLHSLDRLLIHSFL